MSGIKSTKTKVGRGRMSEIDKINNRQGRWGQGESMSNTTARVYVGRRGGVEDGQ